MSEHDALLAAICENPDEDTPRLVLADWLDEHERSEEAAFVRAQVELARTPAWEPFAVLCKWRQTDWLTGKPFRNTLPTVDGFHIEWHPQAFRRGFGWQLNVRSLIAWEEQAAHILDRVPVGEMHLWGATTLDDWRRFAASPIVPRLRRLHLSASPIEPLSILRETPQALGLTDIFFRRASGAGMPEVLEDLLASPLGRVLRGFHFHMGYECTKLLVENLASAANLKRLSFSTMGLTAAEFHALLTTAALRSLEELHIHYEDALGNEGINTLADNLPSGLHDLTLSRVRIQGDGIEALARSDELTSLKRLNLSENPLAPRATKQLAASRSLAGLRSLILNKCRLGDKGVRHLTRAKFWRNLVEVDLRENEISRIGVRHLLQAPLPSDLTALVLDAEPIGHDAQIELRKRYGERLVLTHTVT
jgi:uncharacterized protein (TIGR02996 family)